jgi:hypothetical protein
MVGVKNKQGCKLKRLCEKNIRGNCRCYAVTELVVLL